jgi:phosphoesterase RecJ-like protein
LTRSVKMTQMKISKSDLTEARERIAQAEKILVVSHVKPDGDAVGSVLGIGNALIDAGKQVEMVLEDGMSARYKFMSGSKKIKKKMSIEPDLVIAVDCGDRQRFGKIDDEIKEVDINIDHHPTNTKFARVNLVDSVAASTTQILAKILPALDLVITPPIAEVLLTGIITDTIGFRTISTNADALRTAAGLLDLGLDMHDIYQKSVTGKSFVSVKYWGAGLSKIQKDGQVAWTTLTEVDRSATGYRGRDDADLVNLLSSINEVSVILTFIEQNAEEVKVSWRAKKGYDVSKLAEKFGGGGHIAAAGANIAGTMDEVTKSVLEATQELFNN